VGHKTTLDVAFMIEHLARATWHFDFPLSLPNCLGIYLLSQVARRLRNGTAQVRGRGRGIRRLSALLPSGVVGTLSHPGPGPALPGWGASCRSMADWNRRWSGSRASVIRADRALYLASIGAGARDPADTGAPHRMAASSKRLLTYEQRTYLVELLLPAG